MAGKTLRINGRGGDYQLQIRPFWQQLLKVSEQEIDVQTTFVCFIDDDGVVLIEEFILLNFRQ